MCRDAEEEMDVQRAEREVEPRGGVLECGQSEQGDEFGERGQLRRARIETDD